MSFCINTINLYQLSLQITLVVLLVGSIVINTNFLILTIRDASYATQPLELLNALGFETRKNLSGLGAHTGQGDKLDSNNRGNSSQLASSSAVDDEQFSPDVIEGYRLYLYSLILSAMQIEG